MDVAQESGAHPVGPAGMGLRPVRGQQFAGADRRSALLPRCRRPVDADEEKPAAARPALLQKGTVAVTGATASDRCRILFAAVTLAFTRDFLRRERRRLGIVGGPTGLLVRHDAHLHIDRAAIENSRTASAVRLRHAGGDDSAAAAQAFGDGMSLFAADTGLRQSA